MQETEIQPYDQFLIELGGKNKIEEKIRLCLDFMKGALSKEKTPAFRDFWQAKRLCLDFFKEKMTPRVRTVFWSEYIELSDEIRRLKEVLDEQSSFAHEQIELAIEAIEKDLERKESLFQEIEPIEVPKGLQASGQMYREIQCELDLFNTFAGRLNALRKELIHVNLRIRQKNRLFERLSKLGDQIFPRRKELIQEISSLFCSDIANFAEKQMTPPFFEWKEEIKALQSFAKILSLSTPAFSEMRQKLSECWDLIKEMEKEEHQKRAEKRGLFRENYEKIEPKIVALEEECSSLTLSQAEEKIDALFQEMKELDLGREDVKRLKKRLMELKRPLEEKEQKQKEEQKKAAVLEQERQKETLQQLLELGLEVFNQAEALSLEALVEKWEALVKEKKALSAKGIEMAMLESRLDTIADHVQEKKWQCLLTENPEELSSSLHALLDERHKARRKVKENLEVHRKALGGSALSLEESMLVQELNREEKLRLDAIETMIEEIEEKLFDLEE